MEGYSTVVVEAKRGLPNISMGAEKKIYETKHRSRLILNIIPNLDGSIVLPCMR
jgi:hypothetical protein